MNETNKKGMDSRERERILTNICNQLLKLHICRDPNQELKLLVGGSQPQHHDEDRQDDRAGRINPPPQPTSSDARHESKTIDDDIIPMILPQDPDLGICIPQSPTIQKQTEFRDEGYGNRNHGG